MNEQEVVEVLKGNKNKGIANLFLHEEVRDWVSEHFDEPKLLYLNPLGNWEKFDVCDFDDYDNIVFALPDDYKVKQESKGEWVEFKIDQKGNFHHFADGDMHYFFWANWGIFLKAFPDEFTAFGGWQYPNCGAWYMNPKILLSDAIDTHYADVLFQGEQAECKPAIPVKIRFWRKQ